MDCAVDREGNCQNGRSKNGTLRRALANWVDKSDTHDRISFRFSRSLHHSSIMNRISLFVISIGIISHIFAIALYTRRSSSQCPKIISSSSSENKANILDSYNANTTNELSIYVLTSFYAFADQPLDDSLIQYRYKILTSYTQRCLEYQYQNVFKFQWVILTSKSYAPLFQNFTYQFPHIIYVNEYSERTKYANDLYEITRSGKFAFLRNKLPHLTIMLDSDDCIHNDYITNLLHNVTRLSNKELVLYYTACCYSYDACTGNIQYFDRYGQGKPAGIENFSMGLSLYNNSTNNLLNIGLFGHGKPADFFPNVGYGYEVYNINIPGLYIQTTKSHSRRRAGNPCEKHVYNDKLKNYGLFN